MCPIVLQQPANHDIAESMKKSDHLWLKLASKWAVEEKSEESKATGVPSKAGTSVQGPSRASIQGPPKAVGQSKATEAQQELDFDQESVRLLREMKQKEKEDRFVHSHWLYTKKDF